MARLTPPRGPGGVRFAVLGSGRMAATMRALVGDVRQDEADAVYIATRNADHAAQSIAAMEAGRPVLCEKPFALDPRSAAEVIAVSKRTRLLYMEAVATPFLPAVEAALRLAGEGVPGGAPHLRASFGYRVSRSSHPRLFGPGGGVLADRAVYPLMLALIALGPARLADATVERDADGVDVAARLLLDHGAGGRSDLAVSLVERLDNALSIEGAAGGLFVAPPLLAARRLSRRRPWLPARLRQQGLVRRAGDIAARAGPGWHPYGASPYLPEVAHFCGLLRDGANESPVVSHDRMLAVARLVDEARTA